MGHKPPIAQIGMSPGETEQGDPMQADLRDATVVKQAVDALRGYRSAGGQVKSLKPLRELVGFYWEHPRLTQPRVRSKYPTSSLWSADARASYRADPKKCRLVMEHSQPVGLVLRNLVEGTTTTANEIAEILRSSLGVFVVVSRAEDQSINAAGFRQRMPQGWKPGDDPMARYRAAGLDVAGFRPLESQHAT